MKKEKRNFKKLMTIFITVTMCLVLLPQVSADPIGMVANWHFDEGIGSMIYDETANDNDGTFSGGKFGNALKFDGLNDYVNIPDDSTLEITGDITLEAWININSFSTSAGYHMYIIGKDSVGQRSYGIGVDLTWSQPRKPFVIMFHSGGSYKISWGLNQLVTNQWYHIAGVFDETNDQLNLYVNGIPQTMQTDTSTIYAGIADLRIGARQYSGHECYFNGLIDEVRISNTVRYSGGFSPQTLPFTTDLNTIGLWHFDESIGSTVYDETSNDNDGVIYGANWAGPTWSIIAKYGTYSVHFDGLDDYINVPTSTSLQGVTTQVTVEAWVRVDDVRNAFYVRTPYDNNGRSYGIDRWGGKLRFYIYDGGTINSYHICERAWTPSINTWYHICASFDGSTLRLYLNGGLFQSLSYTGDIDPSYLGVVMGARYQNGGADFHRGYLDEVRIYDYALSSEVVYAHANLDYNPPVANANGPYLVAVGQTITLDGSGSSDPDGDSLTFSWSLAETLGTFDDATLQNPTFTGTLAGITELTLTVNDGYLEDSDTTIIVVYDPTAGFVTGGGWIDSPPGAYVADPLLTGKANFGFVSKYKKGQTTPDGNTEFQFKAGDLNFHSSSYEWLVITGGSKAMFKGVGTINGQGAYKFMITAQDINGGDTFRIKIWEEDTNGDEIVIYDNGVDTVLGGGQIKIHKG